MRVAGADSPLGPETKVERPTPPSVSVLGAEASTVQD